MPDGQSAIRIECNYTLDNCKRQARAECHGDYEMVTKGDLSCADCGWQLSSTPAPTDSGNVYKGVLYVRCR